MTSSRSLSQKEREFSRNETLLDVNHLGLLGRISSMGSSFRAYFDRRRLTLIVRLIVVSRIVRLYLGTIQHHAQDSLARQLLKQTIDDRIARFGSAHDQQRRVGAIDQQIRVGENPERRRVNDDVVEKLAGLVQQPSEPRTRKQ